MNAKVGKECMFRPVIGSNSLHEFSNENGTKLIHFAYSKDFTINSTYYPRKNIYKYIWKSPDGKTHNQIYQILINRRHRECIKNVRMYRGTDADSDHYLVYARFNSRLPTRWNLGKKSQIRKRPTSSFCRLRTSI